MVTFRCIIASFLIGTFSTGCNQKESPVLAISTSVSKTLETLPGEARSINSFFLAPNHRSLVATTTSGDALFFAEVANADNGKLVASQHNCLPYSAWMANSSAFLLYDAPDLLWGNLQLMDVEQLQPFKTLKTQFVTGLLPLSSDRFVIFVESGEQFSSAKRWQPLLYELSHEAGLVSVGHLPTINSPTFGAACKCNGVDVILTANYTKSGDLEAWIEPYSAYTGDKNSRPTKGATFDKEAMTGNGFLRSIVTSDDGTVVVTLWRDENNLAESSEYLIIGRLELTQTDSQGSVLVSHRIAMSDSYKLSKSECDVIDVSNQRLAVISNGKIVAVALGGLLRLISVDSGENLLDVSIPGCVAVGAGCSEDEIIVTTAKGFDVLRLQWDERPK